MRLFTAILFIVTLSLPVIAQSKEDKVAYDEAARKYQEAKESGRENEAKKQLGIAYKLSKKVLNTDSAEFAYVTYNYGVSRNSYGILKEAETLLKSHLDENNPAWITFYTKLGLSHIRKNPYSKHIKKAIELANKTYGKNNLATGRIYYDTAAVLISFGYAKQSINQLQKARKIFEIRNATFDLARANFLQGKYYLQRNKHKQAITEFNKSLAVYNEKLPGSQAVMTTHSFLVHAYEKSGQRDKATEHCQAIGKHRPVLPNQDYKPVYLVAPVYPKKAHISGIQGSITISFTVTDEGFVVNPQVQEGNKIFKTSAFDAIEKFRFAPRYENGVPVPTDNVTYRFKFNLAD